MNRALLVGINAYPGDALQGCVNDVANMATFLTEKCGFAAGDIRILTDERATTAEIKNQLKWFVSDVRAGDRILFHYSGHGAQVPITGRANKVNSICEVICPVDFDWSPELMITDQDFVQIFSAIPPGVEFIWVSDSCHSGGLDREAALGPNKRKARRKIPPIDILWKTIIAKEASMAPLGIVSSAATLNGVLIAGCSSEQTCADAYFRDKGYQGALSYFLLKELNESKGTSVSLRELLGRVTADLKESEFPQDPQLDGVDAIEQKPFLGL